MKPVTVHVENAAIVYDADALPAGLTTPDALPRLFDAGWWSGQGAVTGEAPGRGSSLFLATDFGEAALRRYLRGGMAARLSHDRYVFRGVEASRPFREFDVLARMASDGLPVPEPLAALCERDGLFYRAALLTRRIMPARALPDHFTDRSFDWSRLGAELRSLFDAGMRHADLNARNILVHDDTGAAWVIDLDASRYDPDRPAKGARQLDRLHRSLEKLWPDGAPALTGCWEALLAGADLPGGGAGRAGMSSSGNRGDSGGAAS
jgi:3-deoxy-D-manno-octulosonic acid kinase